MRVGTETFGGIAPKIAARSLPQTAAQTAHNCKLGSSSLRPWMIPQFVSTPTKAGTKQSLFLYSGQYWFHWLTDVNAVKCPIAGDTWERVYFTGDGIPKMTANDIAVQGGGTNYPNNAYTLGVPAPATSPTLAVSGAVGTASIAEVHIIPATTFLVTVLEHLYFSATTSIAFSDTGTVLTPVSGVPVTGQYVLSAAGAYTFAAADVGRTVMITYLYTQNDVTMIETRAYVYTYVSIYGEEGPPCLASTTVDIAPGQSATVSGMDAAPTGAFHIATKRIYRTNTGSSSTAYQFVAEVPVASTTYVDSIASSALGEVMISLDWDMPPAGLSGLINLPNGSLAGFTGNQVCFSEPYQPHAWPIGYRLTTDYPIVAIGAFGTSILVTTTGMPYLITGSVPGSMTQEKAEKGESCVSKRGLVDMGYAIVYPGPDGLWLAGPGVLQKATEKIMARSDWQAFNPSSITGCMYDGKYIGFYNNGTPGSFVFDPATSDFTTASIYATAACIVPQTGKLYLQIGDSLNQWDAGASAETLTWRSKKFQMNRSLNMAAAKVIADGYPVTFKLISDGVLKLTRVVTDTRPFRLPSGFLSDCIEFEVSCENVIDAVYVVESMEDFQLSAWALTQQV
jgi:hypothetical protein